MSEVLFPVAQVPELLTEEEDLSVVYRPSLKWDFKTGDFVRNGANQVLESEGLDTYRTWCLKMVWTERFECLAYPDEIGVEMEEALEDSDMDTVMSAIERTITECLMVNPRTEYVRGFDFSWEGDSIYCSFLVKGIDFDEFEISMEVNADGEGI